MADRLRIPLSPAVVFFAGLRLSGEQLLAPHLTADALGRLANIAEARDRAQLMVEMTERAFELARTEQLPEVSLAHLLRAAALTESAGIGTTLEVSGVSLDSILARIDARTPTLIDPTSLPLGGDGPSLYSATAREL